MMCENSAGVMPTYILRCAHDLPDLMTAAHQPRQAEIHDLYVPERRLAGEEDILRLEEKNTTVNGTGT